MVHARGRCCSLRLSLALSLSDVQIMIRKTYVKELLQTNDVKILPYTQQKKKLETLTDKVTYRVQHEHNVQVHSVTQEKL